MSYQKSFKSAFRSYLLVSAQRLNTPKYFHEKNSTFMVHPDVYNETHSHWKEIISDEVDLWRQDIANNVDNFLRKNRNSFLSAYKDLSKACKINRNKLIDFNILYERYVPGIINTLAITKVNRHSNNINWENAHNILIGGYMLDRGYVSQSTSNNLHAERKRWWNGGFSSTRGRFYGYREIT